MNGKGDTPRPVDGARYRDNYDRIFAPTPSETAVERFERIAAEFHRDTGMTAPGKDVAAEMGTADDYAVRWAAWQEWLAQRRRAA